MILVAFFVSIILHEAVSMKLWTAAGLSVAAIALLNRNPGGNHHHLGLTIVLSGLAAASYALFDVLVQKWAPAWGPGRFIPIMMGIVGLYSMALIPLFNAPLKEVPKAARKPLFWGSAFIALQGMCIITTLAKWGDATAVNVVYSSRGLWSVLAVWAVGHWFANTERDAGKAVMQSRLAGAALLVVAIVLVLV